MDHIFLYGPPGSGKSTLGKVLASRLNLPFVDLDVEIEKTAGTSISRIMETRGEPAFRDLESDELQRVISAPEAVTALGGGALLRAENRSLAESAGRVVCLEADFPDLLQRLQRAAGTRPLLAGDLEARLSSLLEARKTHYGSFALSVCNRGDIQDVAWEIQHRLGRFYVRGMGAGYDVRVEAGGLGRLGELLRTTGLENPLVVSDENVTRLYAEQALDSLRRSGYNPCLLTIPVGESAKRLDTVISLWQGFLKSGLDRRSAVVALGGGVTSDLAGFAAATFMRGVDWVCAPTTLLAMVDASLGGKTGFDLPEGKNLIGAFYAPRLVLADPQVLSTLPEAELRSGLAEALKHGVIADEELFELCARGYAAVQDDLAQVVRRAVAVKVQIIEQDPFERGVRAALNLGHTVGHAVESTSGYTIRHGEAVAIGMVAEGRLAERLTVAGRGVSDRIAAALTGLGLPVDIPAGLAAESIIQSMQFDKKKKRRAVRFALPVRIGEVRTGVQVDDLNLVFAEA